MPGQPNPTETSGLPAPARVWKRLAVNCTVPEIQGFPRVLADGAHFRMAIEVGSIFEFGGGCAVQASTHGALGDGRNCAACCSECDVSPAQRLPATAKWATAFSKDGHGAAQASRAAHKAHKTTGPITPTLWNLRIGGLPLVFCDAIDTIDFLGELFMSRTCSKSAMLVQAPRVC